MSHIQRRFRRVPFAFDVKVDWDECVLMGHCQRVALAGLYVYHHLPIPEGATVGLTFALPTMDAPPIEVRAKVRKADIESPSMGELGGMQLLFEELEPAHEQALRNFVSSSIYRQNEYADYDWLMEPSAPERPYHEVRYFGTDSSRKEYVMDISEGGLRVRTLRPHPVGSEVDIGLFLPGEPATLVQGRVVWSAKLNLDYPSRAGFGVQFQDMDPEIRRRIADFVATFGEE